MSANDNGQLLDFMRQGLERIRGEKTAATTEAGGYSGGSTHPSAKEDDSSQAAPEGARATGRWRPRAHRRPRDRR